MAPRAGTHAEGNGAAGDAVSVPVTTRLRIGMTSIRTWLAMEPVAEPLVARGMGREGRSRKAARNDAPRPGPAIEIAATAWLPIARLATQW